MNLKSIVYFSLFGFAGIHAWSQKATDEIVKINNTSYTVGEFERVYTKNLDLIKDEQQKKIDNYLDLFVLYKLKVAKAYELGLDKKSTYVSEYNMHRKQLAEQYLTNEETLNKLAKEAYERSLYDIRASHIIFLVNESSTPQDTLKAYNKALEVRKEILNGKDFVQAAKEYSQDPSAIENKGDLGYFSVLRMVYPFETGAYNTAIGEVSLPIRSQFGYHLIKVFDKRKRQGTKEIAHIIIENKDASQVEENKKKIDEVYNLLQKGQNFEELVAKYSDDTSSNQKGGVISFYEPGNLSIDGIDEIVYDLKDVNEYSKPFKSQFGWHIVKLNASAPIATYESVKEGFLRRVQSDSRSRIIKEHLTADLKKKYNYKENTTVLTKFSKSIENEVLKEDWTASKSSKNDVILATFSNQKVTSNEFLKYLEENRYKISNLSNAQNLVQLGFEDYVSDNLKTYYENNLENEFPEFKNTAQEFKEGLLLFDLMEDEIWQKVKTDTLGYTNYYNTNINKFKQEESIVGKIFSAEKKSDIKKAHKVELSNFGKTEKEATNKMLNVNLLAVESGKFNSKNNRLPKNYKMKKGVSDIFEENGKYYFVVANEYVADGTLSLDDAKQSVIYEYQQDFEKQWLKSLKENAKVEINTAVLKQLKEKYKQN